MPAYAGRAAEQSDQRTEDDDGGSLLASEEGGLQQIAVDQYVRAKRQSDRDRAAQQAFHRALQQERPADEAVRRADEPHDGDLAAALQHRHADRRPDDDDGDDGKGGADHDPHRGREPAQPVELLDPVAAEADVVHEAEAPQPLRDGAHVLGIAESRLELHLDRRGQRVPFQLLHHVAQLDQLRACAGQRVVFGDVRRGLHFREGLDVLERLGGPLDRRAGQQIRHHLDPLFHAAQGVLKVHDHQAEQSQHEQREGDRRHRQHREQRRALERQHRFAEGQIHGAPPVAWSRASSTAESYTSAPSCSSITRYGACRTRSRSCVAITTAVPLALMSRNSWKTPRVARSSRLPVGSSASSTVGSFTRARAIATRCCSPPDSSRGYACALAARPTCVSTRITRAGIVEARAPVTSSANATFSSAVRSSRRRKSWNTMPSRRRSIGMSLRRIAATVKPDTRTSPLVGRSSAYTSLRTVDFPAPEWPVRNANSPFAT